MIQGRLPALHRLVDALLRACIQRPFAFALRIFDRIFLLEYSPRLGAGIAAIVIIVAFLFRLSRG